MPRPGQAYPVAFAAGCQGVRSGNGAPCRGVARTRKICGQVMIAGRVQIMPQRNNLKSRVAGPILPEVARASECASEEVHDHIDARTYDRCHGAR